MTVSKSTAAICLNLLGQVSLGSIADDQLTAVIQARAELQAVLAADDDPAPD